MAVAEPPAQQGETAVVYLLRKSNPEHLFTAFLESLRRHPAGLTYRPVILLKGFEAQETPPLAGSWTSAETLPLQIVRVSDAGFALTAFRAAARACPARRILFLTSWSRVLAANWLALLSQGLDRLPPGSAVGATGSWEALDARTPFPNVCLRTNAFLIERERFLAFPNRLETQQDGNDFEAGPQNMSRTILESGGEVAVIDRDGRLLKPQDWPQSLTFRSGNQQRLLVADNRTIDYQTAGASRRRRRAARAFGEHAFVTTEPIWRRWQVSRAWRRGAPFALPVQK